MKMLPVWWDDIKHFKPPEFDCPKSPGSGAENMDEDFVRKLDALRERANRPLPISRGGGFRTYGSKTSQHRFGRAADIPVSDGIERYELVRLAIELGFTGIGVYDKHIHVDTRPGATDVMWPGKSQ